MMCTEIKITKPISVLGQLKGTKFIQAKMNGRNISASHSAKLSLDSVRLSRSILFSFMSNVLSFSMRCESTSNNFIKQ